MRVSLARARAPGPRATPLLDEIGARVVVGSRGTIAGNEAPIAPAADTLFGPRGACLAGGQLVVADTGHHRLLVWDGVPTVDHAPAALCVGQPGFDREGRNARGPVGRATLNVPTGVAWSGAVLAVADAWNHRVLLWHGVPRRPDQPADVVLGQASGRDNLANRGADAPTAATLNWCYGVAFLDGELWVADTGNRRVLRWSTLPTGDGAPADLVLGQPGPTTRDDNRGAAPSAGSMRWPHALARLGGRTLVSDAGNNRVMVWRSPPGRDGAAADAVLGQADLVSADHNRGAYEPGAGSLNMPYGVCVAGGGAAGARSERLIVADTANSRLLGFAADALDGPGAPAVALAGQRAFADKGDNRWRPAARDSLCWPYAVSPLAAAGGAGGGELIVADSGNNRVLLWPLLP